LGAGSNVVRHSVWFRAGIFDHAAEANASLKPAVASARFQSLDHGRKKHRVGGEHPPAEEVFGLALKISD
jgi:hypothetical protein